MGRMRDAIAPAKAVLRAAHIPRMRLIVAEADVVKGL